MEAEETKTTSFLNGIRFLFPVLTQLAILAPQGAKKNKFHIDSIENKFHLEKLIKNF